MNQKEVALIIKTNKTITVNDIPQVCDCINNIMENENYLSIDVGNIESEEMKTKIRMFLEGVSYANNTVLNVTEDTYSITVEDSKAFIDCKYSLKKKGTYEKTVLDKNDLILAIDALAEGKTIITDLSEAKEDSVDYFYYLSGAAFILRAALDRIDNDVFIYTPKAIRVSQEQNDLITINEKIQKIDELFEADSVATKSDQIDSMYTECIKTLDKYGYLTPLRLGYSNFLYRIGKSDAAIVQLDQFCELFLKGEAECEDLFKKAVSRDCTLHMGRGGVEELNTFASGLIKLIETNKKSCDTILEVLNAQVEILIENNNSSEAIKILRGIPRDVTKCDINIQLDYLFLKALAMYKIGLFGKSKRIINDMLSKIKPDDCNIMNYIGAKRLQASIYLKKGRYRKAIRIFEGLINEIYMKDPKEYRIPYSNDAASLAGIYMDNNNYDKAKELYRTAIEYSDDKKSIPTYYHNMGVCYVREKNNREAKAKECFINAINLRMELSDDPFYDYCDEILASLEYLHDISEQNNRT